MPKFTALLKETGVDLLNNFMVVGLWRSNLVVLNDAKGFRPKLNPALDVLEVTREELHRVSNTLYDQFITWGLVNEDSTKAFVGAIHNILSFGLHSRLFLVTGKMRGQTALQFVGGRTPLSLNVAVVPQENFTVAFKFLQYLDLFGNLKTTRWQPSDGQWLINKLNWIYGPQANISFRMVEADWVKVSKKFGEDFGSVAFLSDVVEWKNKGADLNIFFVGNNWKGGEAGGTYFLEWKTAAVLDNPIRVLVTKDADPFLVNLAHEVAHFLFDEHDQNVDHIDRPNVLLSTGIQSTRIDKDLVLRLTGL